MLHALHGAGHSPIVYADVKGSVPGPLATRSYPAAALSGITFDRFMRANFFILRLSALDTDRDVAVVRSKSTMRGLAQRMSAEQ
jgi:hypothetical protein